jgi:hypothetical protein
MSSVEPVAQPIVFDQAAIREWIQLCDEEAELRRNGADVSQLSAARTSAVAGLISLIAPSVKPEEALGLFRLLMQESGPLPTIPEDPNMIEHMEIDEEEHIEEVQSSED